MGGKSGSQTIGYKYLFGLHMGISRGPVNELVQINVGEKPVWPLFLVPESEEESPELDEEAFNNLTEITLPLATPLNYYEEGLEYSVDPEDHHVTGIINARMPNKWIPGSFVKITGLTKTQGGIDISLDGVYVVEQNIWQPAVGDLEPVRTLVLTIPVARRFTWKQFLELTYDYDVMLEGEFTLTRVLNIDGDPLPDPELEPEADPDAWRIRSSRTVDIEAPEIFGGEKGEGGVQGQLVVMMGESTQVAPEGLVSMHGESLPGFRRMFTAFFDGMICAMNPYPKPWKFRVRRTTQGWDGPIFQPSTATIILSRPLKTDEDAATGEIHAMNPAHIIFECLTNREWGRGLPVEALNVQSFETSAIKLFNEAFGLCLRWTRTDTIEAFVQAILDHIGATLYQDPVTALLTLKLIRGGYVVDDLPLFEPGNGLLTVSDAPVASAGTYVNAVRVTWHDPIHDEEQTVTVHNLASIQAGGGVFNMVSKTYSGIPTVDLAQRVAQRDLQTMGLELRKLTVVLDRRAHAVRPGDVIRVRDPSRSIRETILRVASFDDGSVTAGAITVVGVQDVFDLPRGGFTGGQGSGWKPPTKTACIGRHEVFEMPYVMYARYLSPADLAYVNDDTGRIGVVAEQGQPANSNYRINTRDGAPTPEDTPTTSVGYCGYVPPSP